MDFVVMDNGVVKKYCETEIVTDISTVHSLQNKTRQKIIRFLQKKPMYASKLAEVLGINEQTVYYHYNVLEKAGIIEEIERKQIRGTVAKKFGLKSKSISLMLSDEFQDYDDDIKRDIPKVLTEFITGTFFDGKIVVGNPEPHGPHKARARDGHYAIDLGIFLGNYARLKNDFSVALDVDIDYTKTRNLIIVGGPVTNLASYKINSHLPCKFSDRRPWGIVTENNIYTDESIGMVAKIKNPYFESGYIMVVAGIRFSGTKSAVLAITRNYTRLVKKNGEFYSIVQGYDLDGDGKIDSIEVLESN